MDDSDYYHYFSMNNYTIPDPIPPDYTVMIMIVAMFAICTLPTALFLLVLILRKQELRQVRLLWYVISGLVAVLMVSLIVQPLSCVNMHRWTLGLPACGFVIFTQETLIMVIQFHLIAITIDKITAIRGVDFYDSPKGRVLAITLICLMWVFSIMTTVAFMIVGTIDIGTYNSGFCYLNEGMYGRDFHMLFRYTVPFFLIVSLGIGVASVACSGCATKRDRSYVKHAMVTTLVPIACYLCTSGTWIIFTHDIFFYIEAKHEVSYALYICSDSFTLVLPFAWMLSIPELRAAASKVCCTCYHREQDEETVRLVKKI